MTCRGFWLVAALSRYTSGCPLIGRSRIGKSARILSTSSGGASWMVFTAFLPERLRPLALVRRGRGLLGPGDPELPAEPLVPLQLELVGELRTARQDDPAVHHHVDVVRGDVVEDPLIVGDEQHADVGPDQLM